MDLAQFLPRALHRPLAYWGKLNWCVYEPISLFDPRQIHLPENQRGETLITIDLPRWTKDTNVPMMEWMDASEFLTVVQSDRIRLTWYYMMSKVLAQGPKSFSPTVEQCESMEEIDIDLSPTDFQQPYQTMMYEFPTEWAKRLAGTHGTKPYPKFGVVHKDNTGFILVGIELTSGDNIVVYMPPTFKSVEDAISKRVNNRSGDILDDAELGMSHIAQRVMLNSAMLLMLHPTKTEPANPKEWAKHRRKGADEKFKMYSLIDIQNVSFQQNIVVRDYGNNAPLTGTANVHSPKPHWRRGHWKMQTHGPQHSLRKRILIRPVFVRSYAFTGDVSQTTVNMRKA